MTLFTFKSRRWLLLSLVSLIGMGGAQAKTDLISGVESLPGVDPMQSKYWQTNTDTVGYHNDVDDVTFFLYNVGTGKFVNMGGAWGTHASLHSAPKYFFLFNNADTSNPTSPSKLNLRTKQSTTKTGNYQDPTQSTDYMQYIIKSKNAPVPGVYFDRRYDNTGGGVGWTFEKTSDYSETNRTYRIYQEVNGTKYYLQAQTADQYGDDVEAKPNIVGSNDNSEWKLISKKQYYELFDQSPADLSDPVDVTFLLRDPDFSVNNRYLSSWHTSGSILIGTGTYPKTSTTAAGYGKSGKIPDNYQLNYGRYFNACIHSETGEFWQGVKVTKPGWFIFRCRGISNLTDANGKVNAILYAQQCTDNTYSTQEGSEYSAQLLNSLPTTVVNAKDKMLQAGKEFAENEHENEVLLYVEPKENTSTYYIRFGVKAGASTSSSTTTASAKANGLAKASAASTESLTIFDTFRMLYAGTTEEPDLILDEENTDLDYLTDNGIEHSYTYTKPADTYTNTTLHLNRTFTLNKWNTIVLPVDLRYAQMKSAFGADVKLAYLWKLTDNSMQFLTVEPSSDEDVMLHANKPYIIYPTQGPGDNPSYTATLHHIEKTTTTSPVAWRGQYQGNTITDGKITIAANHYQIPKVTLNPENINENTVGTTWVIPESDVVTVSLEGKGTMTNYGTLAKTYSGTSIISGRDNCEDAYIMKGGSFYLVPSNKPYGLKAFRTWFKYTSDSGTAKPATFAISINGVEEPVTGIEGLFDDEPAAKVTTVPGVYSLSGQRLRSNSDLSGLPAGIYIVNGKKVVLK